ncbi:MAG TPA: hypothetical protein V6D07_18485 [Trichocoleus sp.]
MTRGNSSEEFTLANNRKSIAAIHRQQQALEQLQVNRKKEALEITSATVLKPNKPTRDQAPYTRGCKKTKSKMNSGGKHPESGSTTTLCKRPIRDDIAFQSRPFESKDQPWRLRIQGNHLLYCNQAKQQTVTIARFVLRDFVEEGELRVPCMEWLVDPSDYHPELQQRAIDFLGLEPGLDKSFDRLPAERRSLVEHKSAQQREIQRRAAKRAKSAARPGKRERAAMQARAKKGKTLDLRNADIPIRIVQTSGKTPKTR